MGGRVTNFTWKSWFLAKKLKKIEKKKLKKIEKNASKASCWVPLTWLEHAQDMSRTCPGHGRTHEDSYGFLKIQNRTKTHQDTDIFVLQIAEQKFQISSHFATKAASKIEPLCSLDMTRTWQDTCGVIGVFGKSEFETRIWQKYRRICTENCNSTTNEFDGNPIHWETVSATESPILYT
jgi:hypothetical protein